MRIYSARGYRAIIKALFGPLTPRTVKQAFVYPPEDEFRRLKFARHICQTYKDKWGWGAKGEFLFRALIRALGIGEFRRLLELQLKPKRGRKEEVQLAERIWKLKAEGKTVPQMRALFESEGKLFSKEAIASYLKTRRRKG